MGWMIADAKDVQDHLRHPLGGPHVTTEAKGFASCCQQGRQLRRLLRTQFRLSPWRWLMAQGVYSLRLGFLHPLAHRSLSDPECGSNVFLFPSLFMQFPGAHPSSFAPIFWRCRFLAHTSFYRPFWSRLYFSLLRSIKEEVVPQDSKNTRQ